MRPSVFAFALFVVALAAAPADVPAQQPAASPCADSLYQVLRARPLQELSEREYEFFMQREKSCTDYQTLNRLVHAPAPVNAAPPRPLETDTYTQGSAVGGGADVYVRNLSDRPIIVNSVRVYECTGLRQGSCGMHYPKTKVLPGQARRVLTIRFQAANGNSRYRYEYHTSAAES